MPYERGSELFADLFGHQLSQATLVNANRTAYEILEPVGKEIKRQVVDSHVVHFNETGMGVNGKVVTYVELTSNGKIIATCYFVYTEVFLVVGIIYSVLASVVAKLLNKLETK